MSSPVLDFCPACGDDRPIRVEQHLAEFKVRGEAVELELPTRVCTVCGTEEFDRTLVSDPVQRAFDLYRERHSLLSPDEIREIRKHYKLSQKSFATLLGMSEATLNRYEGGSVQEATHDNAIRACRNASYVHDLLARRGHLLPAAHRQRLESLLSAGHTHRVAAELRSLFTLADDESALTGFRCFSYERYAAVVIWFCRRLSGVTTIKLNKLLFYADYLYFKYNSVSVTGAAYRKLQYGPAPADYLALRQLLENQELVAVREQRCANGNSVEEYQPGQCADDIKVSFNDQERLVLECVIREFADATPGAISDRSHEESAWLNTPDNCLISYQEAASLSLQLPNCSHSS